MLTELEEVIEFKQEEDKFKANANRNLQASWTSKEEDDHDDQQELEVEDESSGEAFIRAKKNLLLKTWQSRLKCAPRDVEIYRQILGVHTLVADPREDPKPWLKLASLCRKVNSLLLILHM